MRVALPLRIAGTVAVLGLGAVFLLAAMYPKGAPPPDLKAQPGWAVSSAAPVIAAGSLRARALWNDPSVVRTAEGYVMYLTTSVGEPFKPPILPFRAVSSDGKAWRLQPSTPLLRPPPPFASVETPSVVYFGDRWHMFFTGVFAKPDPAPMAIGHAVSADGIGWSVTQPLLLRATGRAGDWNSYLVAEPGAVVVGKLLRVYFSAVGARAGDGPPQSQSIGVVTSADGVTFSAPKQVLVQTSQFAASKGFAGYSSPAAAVVGRDVHLFYSVAHFQRGASPEWRQVAIGEAVSADGVSPFREIAGAVVTTRSAQWSGGEVIGPAPLVDHNRLLLWFGGHVQVDRLGPLITRGFTGPEFGIGLASRSIPTADRPQTSAKGGGSA